MVAKNQILERVVYIWNTVSIVLIMLLAVFRRQRQFGTPDTWRNTFSIDTNSMSHMHPGYTKVPLKPSYFKTLLPFFGLLFVWDSCVLWCLDLGCSQDRRENKERLSNQVSWPYSSMEFCKLWLFCEKTFFSYGKIWIPFFDFKRNIQLAKTGNFHKVKFSIPKLIHKN